MAKTAIVSERPKCDLCGEPAIYDGKTKMGPWAYMCEKCWRSFGTGLGTGKGQKLETRQMAWALKDC